jgi:hypothetical protein
MPVKILKTEFDRNAQALNIGREDIKRNPELVNILKMTEQKEKKNVV